MHYCYSGNTAVLAIRCSVLSIVSQFHERFIHLILYVYALGSHCQWNYCDRDRP